jgi:hypothetical protein
LQFLIMQNQIRLGDALNQMKECFPGTSELKPFDIAFCSYDRTRKKGGDRKEFKKMIRSGLSHDMEKLQTVGIKPYGGKGHPVTVHIRLIEKFNGMEVIY